MYPQVILQNISILVFVATCNLAPMDYDAVGRQFPRVPRPSPTMPLILVFLVIVGLCVVTVWIESNYGILEGIFRIVSTDEERSSVEERLHKYSGSSGKKSKRKRKSKKRKSRRGSARDDSDEDDYSDDQESYRKHKKRHDRKHHKKYDMTDSS